MNPTTAPTPANWLTNARTSWRIPAFLGAFLALISFWALRSAFTTGNFGVAVATAGLFALGFTFSARCPRFTHQSLLISALFFLIIHPAFSVGICAGMVEVTWVEGGISLSLVLLTLWMIASRSHAWQTERSAPIQNLGTTTEVLAEPRAHAFKATSRLNDLRLLHRMVNQGWETGVAKNVLKLTSDKGSSGPLEGSNRHLYTPDFARKFPTRILVAEDNPVNQKLVAFMLEKLGYNLTLAQDGQEAIDLATQQVFDLIFMDLCMPNVGGMEAAKHILATGPTPTIVPLTADASDASRQASAEAGMTGFIAKPFVIGQLCQAIEAAYKAR